MRILYVTRHFNRSGYYILEKLLQSNIEIVGIVLKDERNILLVPIFNHIYKCWYALLCWFYRCVPSKFTNSELLLAKKNNIKIFKIKSIKSDEFYGKLIKCNPDIIVLGGGWHELLPSRVINFPRLGCINTHPSLLPNFRGTSITRWQILFGVKQSGVTIHYIDEQFDSGKIIAQKSINVDANELPQFLFDKLGKLAGDLMLETLLKIEKGNYSALLNIDQSDFQSEYFSTWKWDVDKLKINWESKFEEIDQFIRANHQEAFYYHGPHFKIGEKRYFIRDAKLIPLKGEMSVSSTQPIVVKRSEEGIIIARRGSDSCLLVKKVQRFQKYFQFCRSYIPKGNRAFKEGTKIDIHYN